MNDYIVGEYIIYQNGEKYELGRIKSLREDGAFVAYHEGETGAKTPYSHMHKIMNAYCIKDTTLGGEFFKQAEWGGVMTYEELREEAKRQGYRLVALDSREKLLPCTCGNKRRTHFDTWEGGKWIYMLTCTKCGKTAKGHSVSEVNRNWNEMIKMEMSK